jgi:hypothetical protein
MSCQPYLDALDAIYKDVKAEAPEAAYCMARVRRLYVDDDPVFDGIIGKNEMAAGRMMVCSSKVPVYTIRSRISLLAAKMQEGEACGETQ